MSFESSQARDTQALRWSVLTTEEKEIVKRVNGLIRAVKERQKDGRQKPNNDPWATPEMDRYNNVIMFDGARGSGKTSLLLTMIAGWQNHKCLSDGESEEQQAVTDEFQNMKSVLRCLQPLDFDPLPPDLPLYNWIIQAFEPVVNKVSGPDGSFDEWAADETSLSVRDRFRKLQETAAVGWTTGQTLASNVGDFIVWQNEQQSRWQRLAQDWAEFLDSLFKSLEQAECQLRIEKGAVIVLPIDDLDLQASRVRELLLALRVLRHERLVYVLTGDSNNLNVSLEVEFYRDCMAKESAVTEELQDRVKEQSRYLAFGLFQKTVPEPHRFMLKGIPLSEIPEWQPTGGKNIGDILDDLWPNTQFSKGLAPIFETSSAGKTVPFRTLQGFHDRWQHQSDDLDGIVWFLNMLFLDILVGRHSEEGMFVKRNMEKIEISGNPSRLAPAPRVHGTLQTDDQVHLKWVQDLDFATLSMKTREPGELIPSPTMALPEQRISLDLAYYFAERVIIFAGPSLAEKTLGLLWSEIDVPDSTDYVILVPWPILNEPRSPNEWYQGTAKWNATLAEVQSVRETTNSNVVLEAWFRFNAERAEIKLPELVRTDASLESRLTILPRRVALPLAPLASGIYGLYDDERKAILRATNTNRSGREQLDKAASSRVCRWRRSEHDIGALAMCPNSPDARPDDALIEKIASSRSMSKLFGSQK